MAKDTTETSPETLTIGPDTCVTLSYKLFDAQGKLVEQAPAASPLVYVHGYAQIVPGLERALAGMKKGDKPSVQVEPDEAFGMPDEAGIFLVDKEDFPNSASIVKGDEFEAHGPDGEPLMMRVVEVLADAFMVDANHPLAGQRVRFDVEIGDVRAATDEEIEEAQRELEARIQEEGHACCGHDHGEHGHSHQMDGEPLMQLGKGGARN